MTDTERITRLDAIRERVQAASAGPWVIDVGEFPVHGASIAIRASRTEDDRGVWLAAIHGNHTGEHRRPSSGFPSNDEARANAPFMAHAREDIPWLLAEIERLKKGN